MESQNKRPIGIAIPIKRGNLGFFDYNYTTIDQISTNIKNLLLTIRGERRLNVNFGSDLYKILFEQETPVTLEELRTKISNLIRIYFPYLQITMLNVYVSEEIPGAINIDMKFMLTSNGGRVINNEEGNLSLVIQ